MSPGGVGQVEQISRFAAHWHERRDLSGIISIRNVSSEILSCSTSNSHWKMPCCCSTTKMLMIKIIKSCVRKNHKMQLQIRSNCVKGKNSVWWFIMKEFLLDKFLLENNKRIEGIESFSGSLSLVSYMMIDDDITNALTRPSYILSTFIKPVDISIRTVSFMCKRYYNTLLFVGIM